MYKRQAKGRRAAKKEKKKVRYEKAALKQSNDARGADPAGAPSPDPPPPRETVSPPLGDRGGRPHAAASGDQLLFGSSAVRREARSELERPVARSVDRPTRHSRSAGVEGGVGKRQLLQLPPIRDSGDRRNIASAPNLNWGHGHVRHSI